MELLAVTGPGIAYICLGGFVFTFSLISILAKEKVFINEVVLGTGFGIIMGPYGAVMRVVLAIGLFAIGVELPKTYMAKHAKSLSIMVVPTMGIGWVVVAGLIRVLFPQLDFISCLAISACLTPTDPIVCSATVGGKFARDNVPDDLRHILSAESAANDGLAYPFLTLSIYLSLDTSRGVAISHWLLVGCLYQVVLGTITGAILGLAFSYLIKSSRKNGFITRESYVAQYLALALFVTGIVSTIGSDDLLAAFAAGCAIAWDGEFHKNTEKEIFAPVLDLLLNCVCFIYIGAWIPFNQFTFPELGINPWRLAVLACGIMFLRRIPALLMLYNWIPEIASWRQALFSGHFGPMGVGGAFISTLALHKLPIPSNPPQSQQDILALAIPPIVCFIILSSIIIHGLSISFFSLGKGLSLARTITLIEPKPEPKTGSNPHTIHMNLNSISISREAIVEVPNIAVDEAGDGVTDGRVRLTDTSLV